MGTAYNSIKYALQSCVLTLSSRNLTIFRLQRPRIGAPETEEEPPRRVASSDGEIRVKTSQITPSRWVRSSERLQMPL